MISTLNSLRFILILMIMISHSTLPISQDLINYLGEFPVAIFFVISGFVLSLSKGEKLQKEVLGNRNFFLSRIIKLYPLHILILAILILMDWRLGRIFLCHNLCFRIIQSILLKRYGEGNPHQEFQFILSLAFIILTAWIAKKAIVLPIQHQLQKYL